MDLVTAGSNPAAPIGGNMERKIVACINLKANAEQCADCARLPQTPEDEDNREWIKLVQTPCRNWVPCEPNV